MHVKLLRDARIRHIAGEIVEVSPAEAAFLTSVGSAVVVEETLPIAAPAEEQKPAAKPAAKKYTGAKKKA